jgi:hypothetical protein
MLNATVNVLAKRRNSNIAETVFLNNTYSFSQLQIVYSENKIYG